MQSALFVYLTNKDVFHTFFQCNLDLKDPCQLLKLKLIIYYPALFLKNFNVSLNV